jgi:hypothetical protein
VRFSGVSDGAGANKTRLATLLLRSAQAPPFPPPRRLDLIGPAGPAAAACPEIARSKKRAIN